MAAPQEMTVSQLTVAVKTTYGLSWREMGETFGRNERWMRKLAKGEAKGEGFREGLTEFYDKGHISHYVPRRRTKSGELVKVRSQKGATGKSVTPHDTRGRKAPPVGRNTFSHHTQHFPNGARQSTTTLPKSPRSKNRAKGWASVETDIRSVSKSQRKHDQRIKATFVVQHKGDNSDRRIVDLGAKSGYHASDILSDVRTKHGGDFGAWADDQLSSTGVSRAGTSAPDSMADYTIVSVQLTSFRATRTKETRKAQDRAGTRRRGRWG